MKRISEKVLFKANKLKFSKVDLLNKKRQEVKDFEVINALDRDTVLVTIIPKIQMDKKTFLISKIYNQI